MQHGTSPAAVSQRWRDGCQFWQVDGVVRGRVPRSSSSIESASPWIAIVHRLPIHRWRRAHGDTCARRDSDDAMTNRERKLQRRRPIDAGAEGVAVASMHRACRSSLLASFDRWTRMHASRCLLCFDESYSRSTAIQRILSIDLVSGSASQLASTRKSKAMGHKLFWLQDTMPLTLTRCLPGIIMCSLDKMVLPSFPSTTQSGLFDLGCLASLSLSYKSLGQFSWLNLTSMHIISEIDDGLLVVIISQLPHRCLVHVLSSRRPVRS